MKKSKLTGALAVGGGLKQAIIPYIITGEENNGYSKGDILDANYVKQLIKQFYAKQKLDNMLLFRLS